MWTDLVKNILGVYEPLVAIDGTPLQGIGSINFPWVVNAVILIGGIFMILKIVNSFVSRIGR